ncbi:NAD(P)/FAD-dependent oxidoreductase [Tahibacter amnicola]|uniref:FAD-binding oxidoreductase n=1 Tax=Tahibacter amnicola TaxID=2976241 RepID=A0ABY6BB00_9GAMM|nr:FAD-dependent oxidoreductase [Tahibacter amnicola]UXI67234.1 FAD-binding oxidoreductase [Tahibacter amnicola]
MIHDVLIVGGGIVGCAIAERLALGGLSVCLVERDCIGGGATAASMGHLVVLDDDPAELALSAWSCERWRILADALPAGADYRATGTLWVARDGEEMEEAERKQARLAGAGIASEMISAATLARLEPALAERLAGGLRVPSDAVVYPPVAAAWLARQAAAAGADILSGIAVRNLDPAGVVLADGREVRADKVIIANGCAAPELLPAVPIRKRKGHLLITTRGAPTVTHQLVELGYIKSAHSTEGDSVAFNLQPRPTGQWLLGSTRQFDDTTTGVTPRLVSGLIERGKAFVPALAAVSALRAWTGFRPTTPDHRPLIGAWPSRPGTWLACGHEGLGVTTALGTADLIAAQLLQTATPFDAEPFAPARFAAEYENAA